MKFGMVEAKDLEEVKSELDLRIDNVRKHLISACQDLCDNTSSANKSEMKEWSSEISVEFDNIGQSFADLENHIDKLREEKDVIIKAHNALVDAVLNSKNFADLKIKVRQLKN